MLGLRLDEPLALAGLEPRSTATRSSGWREAGSWSSAPTPAASETLALTPRGRFLGGGGHGRAARLSVRVRGAGGGAR